MNVTAKLLSVFLVDKQFRGLRSRLAAAERFLAEQNKLIEQLDAKKASLDAQVRQITATASNFEGEMKRLDARMATIREQMDSAQTNKEYKAFLTEVNTIKAERDRQETSALEHMGKVEDLKKQLDDIIKQRTEREKVQAVAVSDRDQRSAEIKDRLTELQTQRDALAKELPKDTLVVFERLVQTRGDEAMAHIEEVDRKRHEYHCGSCMMALPIEAVNGLLVSGRLTRCASCQCILYISEELTKSMREPVSKR
jgi:predicted  nucleic acid-binding Zn-ribbon protein